MKKLIILLSILMLLSACTHYPENEIFVCKNQIQLEEGYEVVVETLYYAEQDYITKVENIARVMIDQELESRIELSFGGDRQVFMGFLTKAYEPEYNVDFVTIKFKDLGTYFETKRTSYRPEIVRDWRTSILPEYASLTEQKKKLEVRGSCKP